MRNQIPQRRTGFCILWQLRSYVFWYFLQAEWLVSFSNIYHLSVISWKLQAVLADLFLHFFIKGGFGRVNIHQPTMLPSVAFNYISVFGDFFITHLTGLSCNVWIIVFVSHWAVTCRYNGIIKALKSLIFASLSGHFMKCQPTMVCQHIRVMSDCLHVV